MEAQEIKRREKELAGTVKLPAEAESFKVETIAQGKRYGAALITCTMHKLSTKAQTFLTFLTQMSPT